MAPVVRKTVGLRRLCIETAKRLVANMGLDRLEPSMSVARCAADVLREHLVFEIECVDRLYLNVFQPRLQLEPHVYHFLRQQRGAGAVSACFFQTMTRQFVHDIEAFAEQHQIPLFTFERSARKEDVAAEHRARFQGHDGVLFIGKAQEKVTTFRTEERRNARGESYPWLVKTTALVNQYYFYLLDDDFGVFFLKFSSYFPHGGRLCLNGHEYLKRQLAKEGIAFEALANGLGRCADPKRAQAIANELTPERIDALLRKWLTRLPQVFTTADAAAGFRYELSILGVEFALTQVLDRPVAGRVFFESVIRDNLDIGRPDRVQLIFNRKVIKTTPGRFRTRVVTEGVLPSLYVDYKKNRLKQYFKEGRALRTEMVINDPWDFRIGRLLKNLPRLRELGFQANRRLLDVQRVSQDGMIGETVLQQLTQPCQVGRQRASGLPYADPMTLALLHLLLLFRLLPLGFRNYQLREYLARLRGEDPATYTQGRLTYQLRRLRLHALIERQAGTHSYRVTDTGLRVALFVTRSYACLVRPGLAALFSGPLPEHATLQHAFADFDNAFHQYAQERSMFGSKT
jgi:hypothetical protein